MNQFEGFEYPTVRESIEDVAGPYGAVYITSKFGRRILSFGGDIIDQENAFSVRQAIVTLLRQTGRMKLIEVLTYDDLSLQFEAEVVRYTNPYNHQVHTYQVELQAPDWRFYSQTLNDVSIYTGPVNITNAGNEQTDPIFTIEGLFTDGFTLENLTTGKLLTFDGTVTDGETLTIDIKNRYVFSDLDDNRFDELDPASDFFSLEPGINQIMITPAAGTNGNTAASIQFRDAYLGL